MTFAALKCEFFARPDTICWTIYSRCLATINFCASVNETVRPGREDAEKCEP